MLASRTRSSTVIRRPVATSARPLATMTTRFPCRTSPIAPGAPSATISWIARRNGSSAGPDAGRAAAVVADVFVGTPAVAGPATDVDNATAERIAPAASNRRYTATPLSPVNPTPRLTAGPQPGKPPDSTFS
jgi:hypothetical protein